MRTYEYRRHPACDTGLRKWRRLSVCVAIVGSSMPLLGAQTTTQQGIAQQIQDLTNAVTRTQAELQATQRELVDMRMQLAALKQQIEVSGSGPVGAAPLSASGSSDPASSVAPQSGSASAETSAIQDLRERQALQESQIATLDQSKVESESKYPVKLTGLILMNGFVNTGAVEMPATPTVALPGPGTTGATVRQ